MASDLPSGYYWNYVLQRACEVQTLSHAIPGPNVELTLQARELSARDRAATDPENQLYRKVFDAAVRRCGVTLRALAGDPHSSEAGP